MCTSVWNGSLLPRASTVQAHQFFSTNQKASMTHKYIGTKIVTAWAAEKDGQPGYGVKYADGYTSWSPKEAFEDAYRDIEGPTQALTFSDALHMLKLGKKLSRAGWNGKGLWLEYHQPMADVDLHYIRMSYPVNSNAYPKGARVPWLPSQTDMLAEDWVVEA